MDMFRYTYVSQYQSIYDASWRVMQILPNISQGCITPRRQSCRKKRLQIKMIALQ